MPASLKGVTDNDPFPYYDALRNQHEPVWDEFLNSWLLVSQRSCKELLRADNVSVMHPDFSEPVMEEVRGGHGNPQMCTGETHTKLHNWLMNLFSPHRSEHWRENKIRPIIHDLLDEFILDGQAEMISQFTSEIGVRVISSLMDLPSTGPWVQDVIAQMTRISQLFNQGHIQKLDPATDLATEARTASARFSSLFRPYLEKRQKGEGDDLISQIWREGPDIIEGFDFDFALSLVRALYFGAGDTTSFATANGLYLLLTRPALSQSIELGGETSLTNFVEEVLRLHGAVHFRPRRVIAEMEIAGHRFLPGDTVTAINSAGNRDPDRYAQPNEVTLNRRPARDHLAFNFGPRTCIGAALARVEMQEAFRGILTRLKDFRLDPGKPAPIYTGFLLRAYQPLHVQFTSRQIA